MVYDLKNGIPKFKTVDEIKEAIRVKKTEGQIIETKNYSLISLKDKILRKKFFYRRNFSFCDFNKLDIRGFSFLECNFCFSVNLDKTIRGNTKISKCNFYCADYLKTDVKGNYGFFTVTNNDIEKHFEQGFNLSSEVI